MSDAVREALKALDTETFYEGGEMARGISVRFLMRLNIVRDAAGLEVPKALLDEARAALTDFHCGKCGKETDTAPDPPRKAVCAECCEDHDYRYEAEMSRHVCLHCGQEAPQEFYDAD